MNIKALLEEKLWNVIDKNYTNQNYTGAIDDAVFYIRDLIREKSNLENDGDDLINQAFSEKNPKIKLNKLRTKHDKNIQNGMRESLIGVWKLIRNTRSHEKHNDTKEDALSIIMYINYLSKLIEKAKSSFSVRSFIGSVYDEHFEQTNEYAKLLVDEIPNKQREEVFYQLYQSISYEIYEYTYTDGYDASFELKDNHRKLASLKLVVKELIRLLKDDELEIFKIISNDFHTLSVSTEFYWKLSLLVEGWKFFEKKIQLRTRNILKKPTGDYDYAFYKNKILLDGWKSFDQETRDILYNKFMKDNVDYKVKDDKLIYMGNDISLENITKKIEHINRKIFEEVIPF